MVALFRRLRPIAALVASLVLLSPARAEQQDITAAARSVVRVALVATNGADAYFVGHGSGIAIAPDKVLTNAHVVELAREEKDLVIGVIQMGVGDRENAPFHRVRSMVGAVFGVLASAFALVIIGGTVWMAGQGLGMLF
jgi:hypothetical protein